MDHVQRCLETSDTDLPSTNFLEGRWYRLASRAIRKGWLKYDSWNGDAHDYRRERLFMDDIEREMVEELADADPARRQQIVALRMPWLASTDAVDDPDRLYEEVVNEEKDSGRNKPIPGN